MWTDPLAIIGPGQSEWASPTARGQFLYGQLPAPSSCAGAHAWPHRGSTRAHAARLPNDILMRHLRLSRSSPARCRRRRRRFFPERLLSGELWNVDAGRRMGSTGQPCTVPDSKVRRHVTAARPGAKGAVSADAEDARILVRPKRTLGPFQPLLPTTSRRHRPLSRMRSEGVRRWPTSTVEFLRGSSGGQRPRAACPSERRAATPSMVVNSRRVPA
jgi:hypothetical protein